MLAEFIGKAADATIKRITSARARREACAARSCAVTVCAIVGVAVVPVPIGVVPFPLHHRQRRPLQAVRCHALLKHLRWREVHQRRPLPAHLRPAPHPHLPQQYCLSRVCWNCQAGSHSVLRVLLHCPLVVLLVAEQMLLALPVRLEEGLFF